MTSIYETIRTSVASGQDVEDLELNDEDVQPSAIRWTAGAWDGVVSHHVGADGHEPTAESLSAALVRAATGVGYEQLCALADTSPILSVIDATLDDLRTYNSEPTALERLGLRMAREATTRGPVKLGIALLGRFGTGQHRDVLLLLGRHGEFTLFAAVALAHGPGAEDDLWRLAQQAHGWGESIWSNDSPTPRDQTSGSGSCGPASETRS